MALTQDVFEKLGKIISEDGLSSFISILCNKQDPTSTTKDQTNIHEQNLFILLRNFIKDIITTIDELVSYFSNDESVLVSVKNQKTLRTCFQLITSMGLSTCLLPGLGISLNKRSINASLVASINLNDEQKYEMLVLCTNFFITSYNIPILKKIIITFHLSDYLASLIQLSFAPLKKPGSYKNFIMTKELYEHLLNDRSRYLSVYENLVSKCFQPILMKELLILQGVYDPSPPMFVKRVISKEMSKRLLIPGGLSNLIRCFFEGYGIDTGLDWQKHDLICKIVSTKHGTASENDYLTNICAQLGQLLCLSNPQYIPVAVRCIHSLSEKYPHSNIVQNTIKEIFKVFDCDSMNEKCVMPGTIALTTQEIDHQVDILHYCLCTPNLKWPVELVRSNLFVLYLIGLKNTNNNELKSKLIAIILKILDAYDNITLCEKIDDLLFYNNRNKKLINFVIEEYESGIIIKCGTEFIFSRDEALAYFVELIKSSSDQIFIYTVFEILLNLLIRLTSRRKNQHEDTLFHIEDEPELLTETDHQYMTVLQLLSEMATLPKIISSVKENSVSVTKFIEYFLLEYENSDECVTIALVLLHTVLTNSKHQSTMQLSTIIPIIKKIEMDKSNLNHILCKDILYLLSYGKPVESETPYSKAMSDAFNNLLPTQTHGLIELTKLIEAKDPETISRKHYIFCLFQERLKDRDSYVYLAAINGLSALGTHCTDDVLHVLCKEFLNISSPHQEFDTNENQSNIVELRMKIGDVIVKVTKNLGAMAVLHKTILLNTILCGCRDDDPLIRTSAISNLADIALVLNYKLGTIIYEVLLCIWSIIESDKAIECRRAAVMVISSLVKGLGKETLIELKENLLPIYRILKKLYNDSNEDSVLKLHAQIALEELNEIVEDFLFPKLNTGRNIFIGKERDKIIFK